MHKFILTATTALALLSPATAHAATSAQAKSAVLTELKREYHARTAQIDCKRLTSTRYRCTYWSNVGGNVGEIEGAARVTFYGRTPDVILF